MLPEPPDNPESLDEDDPDCSDEEFERDMELLRNHRKPFHEGVREAEVIATVTVTSILWRNYYARVEPVEVLKGSLAPGTLVRHDDWWGCDWFKAGETCVLSGKYGILGLWGEDDKSGLYVPPGTGHVPVVSLDGRPFAVCVDYALTFPEWIEVRRVERETTAETAVLAERKRRFLFWERPVPAITLRPGHQLIPYEQLARLIRQSQ